MARIARFFLIISILWQVGLSQAQAADAIYGILYSSLTISFGKPVPLEPLPAEGFRLFVWNIHKAVDPRMPQDFADLTYGADIALLQEGISEPSFITDLTLANVNFGWTMAKSFQQSATCYTGVATGARSKPLKEEVIVSTAREPWSATPKTILISEFAIENTADTLMVANIHGINFVGLETYKTQILQLVASVSAHQGPLIVAGDFNTWEPARLYYLNKMLAPLGLKQVKNPAPPAFLDLDHIFIRGMDARFTFNLSHIDSSDHAPLMVDLTFNINKVMLNENTP